MSKYYNEKVRPGAGVSYNYLDKERNVIGRYPNQGCFYYFTRYGVPKNLAFIHVYSNKALTPYDDVAVKRWVDDLTEIGFPCSVIQCPEREHCHNIEIDVSDYKYKTHLMGTLMLLRALTETGIANVPEIYFEMLDDDPMLDKFDAIQTAHKKTQEHYKLYPSRGLGGAGHMATFEGNGLNVDRETLFKRYKQCGILVHHGEPGSYVVISQSDKWAGEPYRIAKSGCKDCYGGFY